MINIIGGRFLTSIRAEAVRSHTIKSLTCKRFQSTRSPVPTTAANSGIRWFYATDIPKTKPEHLNYRPEKPASKYVPFSYEESRRIESAYQSSSSNDISVKEDGLFQCLIREREMGPIYWDGPTYDVRRGLWFYDVPGKNLSPLPEDLAMEIETLYQNRKTKDGDNNKPLDLSSISGKLRFSKEPKPVAWISPNDTMVLQRIASLGDSKVVRGYHYESPVSEEERTIPEEEAIPQNQGNSATEERKAENRFKELFSWSTDQSARKLEQQMENDYNTNLINNIDCAREVDHLILCVHGIGQKLATKIESVNFVHDINMLRKQMKDKYIKTEALQKSQQLSKKASSLVSENEVTRKTNNGVQVLPVLWRHNIDFGMTERDRKHQDDVTLEDVNVDGVMALRNIVGDVILDVLLYKQGDYKRQILNTVTKEINRIVEDFSKRNPKFAENPKISLVGHSLGSAICFDILNNQKEYKLNQGVYNFYAVGSPLGLFELINKRQIDEETLKMKGSFYNIFHPCDPVAYRVEPLVDRKAAKVSPKLVPYTRGGLTSQIQELSDLGNKISSSASNAWDNFTTTFYSKTEATVHDLFKKSIGDVMNSDESNKMNQKQQTEEEQQPKEDDDYETKKKKQEIIEIKDEIKEKIANINSTNRIDYVLQEGVLDISLIAALASHMSYFENEDVAAFILQQTYAEQHS